MNGSNFISNYKCHKKIPKRGGSYTDSPTWIRIKKATINPINQDVFKILQHLH